MKPHTARTIGWMVLLAAAPGIAADLQGPYLSQSPPGLEAEVFAPGVVSLPGRYEYALSLSPDGQHMLFTADTGNGSLVLHTQVEDGRWTQPAPVSLSGGAKSQEMEAFFSPDGSRIYFAPFSTSTDVRIWSVDVGPEGWHNPRQLGPPVSNDPAFYPTCSMKGTLYYTNIAKLKVYRAVVEQGQVREASDAGLAFGVHSFISPDEDFVLINSSGSDTLGKQDIYVAFRKADGAWASPRNLGPRVNTSYSETCPSLSPDGKCLFFSRYNEAGEVSNMYWIESHAVLPDPNGPIYNLSTGQRFASIQAAVNFAESGQVILVSPGTYRENLTWPNIQLTIRGANAQDSAVVALTNLAGTMTLSAGTAQRSIQGLTITCGTEGIVCAGAELSLSSCVITGHRDCGIEVSEESTLSLDHCIVAGNGGAGLRSVPKTTGRGLLKLSKVDLNQCTIVQNRGYGLEGDGIIVSNSILYGNGLPTGDVQIKGNNVQVSYSNVHGGFGGQGNLNTDPLLVTPGTWSDPNNYVLGDCHLRSQAGHWNPRTSTWVLDDVTSPCIDAGDPAAGFGVEPTPNGGRVNQGAYGNTAEASKSTGMLFQETIR
jgi:hypothetical protein